MKTSFAIFSNFVDQRIHLLIYNSNLNTIYAILCSLIKFNDNKFINDVMMLYHGLIIDYIRFGF